MKKIIGVIGVGYVGMPLINELAKSTLVIAYDIDEDKIYKFENILVYFVFRYLMKAVFDYDALAKIKTAIISYMMIRELAVVRYIENYEFTDEDMVDIAHTYSKDIEHLEENIEALAELFETNEVFDIEEMVMALMN